MTSFFGLLGNGQNPTIVSDTFTRADSALVMGTADTGQTWSGNGVMGISSNQAYAPSSGFPTQFVETGCNDNFTVQTTMTIVDNGGAQGQAIWFRVANGGNDGFYGGIGGGGWNLRRKVGGVDTVVGTGTGTPANGDVVKITVAGTALKLYVNGVLKINITDTNNTANTKMGLSIFQSTTPRIDNFSVKRGIL